MIQQIALTIKPTMNCNMKCKHCFNGDAWKLSDVLSVDLAKRFVEIAVKDYQLIKVTFHGGEPTLVGDDFYRKFFDFERKLIQQYGVKFNNLFTTNGVALTENLIDLLIANDTLINISFDGPFNDILRQNTEIVYENIEKVKSKKGRMRIFCTVSSIALGKLKEIYKWFSEKSLDFKILPIEPRGYAKKNSQYLMLSDRFSSELAELYNYWLKDTDCKIRIYTFEEFIKLKRHVQFKPFWFNREIALNPDGKIYPFGRPNDINFCLGSVTEVNSIVDCFKSDEYERMFKILRKYHKNFCANCPSKGVCNGVVLCMSYMYESDNEMLKDGCQKANNIFQHILDVNDKFFKNFDVRDIANCNPMIKDLILENVSISVCVRRCFHR